MCVRIALLEFSPLRVSLGNARHGERAASEGADMFSRCVRWTAYTLRACASYYSPARSGLRDGALAQ
jgi:hypothetical protein